MTKNNSPILRCENIHAWYGEKQVVKNISIKANCGEFICIIGPNGSGKSTFLALIAGIERTGLRSKGDIFIQEKKIHTMQRQEVALNVSFMTQSEQSVWDFLVHECVLSGRFAHTSWSKWYSKEDKKLVESSLNELNIAHLADRSIHSLSGGELQRVRIARSIVQQSPIILLDEPVANLDIGCQDVILKKMRDIAHNKNTCVIIAIHDLNAAAAFADKIILMKPLSALSENENQIIIGTAENIFKPDILNSVYNAQFTSFKHPIFGYPQICIVDPPSS